MRRLRRLRRFNLRLRGWGRLVAGFCASFTTLGAGTASTRARSDAIDRAQRAANHMWLRSLE